ncbi:DUF6387 family protein [Raoultella ornithinolytica]|uniref:DUF6387 family protein n=1 Tax=Raoultella ornithinolytica TaxID=54291 RepID=UPI003D6E0F02
MPKITQKQKVELTRWFKPGNYLALKDLTLRELYYEFVLRHQKYINRRQSTSFFMPEIRTTQGFTRFFP